MARRDSLNLLHTLDSLDALLREPGGTEFAAAELLRIRTRAAFAFRLVIESVPFTVTRS